MDLSSFIGLWSESKMISGGKPCSNWLTEVSSGAAYYRENDICSLYFTKLRLVGFFFLVLSGV